MQIILAGQRVGVLQVEVPHEGAARPARVTLRNDGFWDGPGWLVTGQHYRLERDERGWRVRCADWSPAVAAHDWRLADADGRMVERLALTAGVVDLDAAASYEIAETDGQWALHRA